MYTAIAGQFDTEEAAALFAAAVQEICQPYGYQVIRPAEIGLSDGANNLAGSQRLVLGRKPVQC
jgi:hypothetical protein